MELLRYVLLQGDHGQDRRLDLRESEKIGRGQLVRLDGQALTERNVDGELLVAAPGELGPDGVADCAKAGRLVEAGVRRTSKLN